MLLESNIPMETVSETAAIFHATNFVSGVPFHSPEVFTSLTWHVQVTLEDEYTPEAMRADLATRLDQTSPPLDDTLPPDQDTPEPDGGYPDSGGCVPGPVSCSGIERMDGDQAQAYVSRTLYRIRLRETEPGVVYTLPVLEMYHAANFSLTTVMRATNYFGLGTGGTITLTPPGDVVQKTPRDLPPDVRAAPGGKADGCVNTATVRVRVDEALDDATENVGAAKGAGKGDHFLTPRRQDKTVELVAEIQEWRNSNFGIFPIQVCDWQEPPTAEYTDIAWSLAPIDAEEGAPAAFTPAANRPAAVSMPASKWGQYKAELNLNGKLSWRGYVWVVWAELDKHAVLTKARVGMPKGRDTGSLPSGGIFVCEQYWTHCQYFEGTTPGERRGGEVCRWKVRPDSLSRVPYRPCLSFPSGNSIPTPGGLHPFLLDRSKRNRLPISDAASFRLDPSRRMEAIVNSVATVPLRKILAIDLGAAPDLPASVAGPTRFIEFPAVDSAIGNDDLGRSLGGNQSEETLEHFLATGLLEKRDCVVQGFVSWEKCSGSSPNYLALGHIGKRIRLVFNYQEFARIAARGKWWTISNCSPWYVKWDVVSVPAFNTSYDNLSVWKALWWPPQSGDESGSDLGSGSVDSL